MVRFGRLVIAVLDWAGRGQLVAEALKFGLGATVIASLLSMASGRPDVAFVMGLIALVVGAFVPWACRELGKALKLKWPVLVLKAVTYVDLNFAPTVGTAVTQIY